VINSAGTPRGAGAEGARQSIGAFLSSKAGEGVKDSTRGSVRCGPRRFTNSMDTPSTAGRMARRSGEGEASCADVNGRTMKKRVSEDCAARWRRRNDSCRTWFCQNTRTLQVQVQVQARSVCSAAQSASAVRSGCMTIQRSSGTPQFARASELGRTRKRSLGKLSERSRGRLHMVSASFTSGLASAARSR
jgi:hypothetical protein